MHVDMLLHNVWKVDLINKLQRLNAVKKSITFKEFIKYKSLFIHSKPIVFYVRVSLVVCPCVFYLMAIVLSVLHRYTDYD